MHVMVTGGAGFIGSTLVNYCLDHEHSVMCVDDLSTGKLENIDKRVQLVLADFASDFVCDILKNTKFDAIMHCAAVADISKTISCPVETHDTNCTKTLKFLNACKKQRRFVFASSAAVYDLSSPYGIQKITCELYSEWFSNRDGREQDDVDCVNMRLHNVYGKRANAGVIKQWTESVINNKFISIHGDGRQTRDFVDARDVASAFFAAAKFENNFHGMNFDVGTGVKTTMLDLAGMFIENFGLFDLSFAKETSVGVVDSVANVAPTRALLGWEPTITLKDGLDDLWTSAIVANGK